MAITPISAFLAALVFLAASKVYKTPAIIVPIVIATLVWKEPNKESMTFCGIFLVTTHKYALLVATYE